MKSIVKLTILAIITVLIATSCECGSSTATETSTGEQITEERTYRDILEPHIYAVYGHDAKVLGYPCEKPFDDLEDCFIILVGDTLKMVEFYTTHSEKFGTIYEELNMPLNRTLVSKIKTTQNTSDGDWYEYDINDKTHIECLDDLKRNGITPDKIKIIPDGYNDYKIYYFK